LAGIPKAEEKKAIALIMHCMPTIINRGKEGDRYVQFNMVQTQDNVEILIHVNVPKKIYSSYTLAGVIINTSSGSIEEKV